MRSEKNLTIDVLMKTGVIPVPGRSVSKHSKNRYIVYLPTALNNLWKYMHEVGTKFTIIIIVDDTTLYNTYH